ncbi:MAG: zinc-ribbon domain-containing protein [Deltaproteobacteria bacterium]|nr:zinc-ribbon domain-containing protein [Deltaproteobacteria bacterium]MDQ3300823.1 zinc-ribbon domain-containing protein [Myxococcota bacterium]
MKIVCDACQAKYSISDDKVQGKVFKIRCKKCSNIIVVRGGAGAAEPPAPTQEKETRVYDYGYEGGDQPPAGDDAVWHVVINQDQVGPMTAAEVQQRFTGGEIDADTYIWREGFADWLPIAQVDTFAGFVASGSSTTTASPGGGGAAAVSSMFGGGGGDEAGTVRSDPGDLFAAASSSARGGHSDDDGDLFGSKPSSASSSQSAASSKLRGERNENSVLFSLGNLAQLASDRPAPSSSSSSASSSSSSSGAGHATGAAGGEGSGLIDIRSMANAYMGSTGAAKASTSSAIGSLDDLPVFGGGGFSEPAVIVPTSSRQNNSKLMYALIGSVGLLAVAAVILVIVMLTGDKDKPAQVAAVTSDDKTMTDKPAGDMAGSGSAMAPVADTGSGSAGSAAMPPATDKPAEPPTVADTSADKPTADKPDTKKPTTTRKDRPSGQVATRAEKPAKTEPTPVKDSGGGGCDEVSCVLNNYEGSCCAKYKKGGSKTATPSKSSGGGDTPESLDRTMISEGVGKVKARVMACGDKSSAKGQVKVSVKVNPDGSVSSVSVKDTPDAGLGRCVASAMEKASFKKTQNGGSFGYPFVF